METNELVTSRLVREYGNAHRARLAERYPRILACAQYAAILSDGEALCWLDDVRCGRQYSGEAVNHYGGTRAVLAGAWRVRRYVLPRMAGARVGVRVLGSES